MGQMLTWRTLRAKIGTTSYVAEQPFFHNAPESNKSRTQVRADTERLNAIDPVIAKLNAQRSELAAGVTIGGLADIDDPFASIEIAAIRYAKKHTTQIGRLSKRTLTRSSARRSATRSRQRAPARPT